ncbi:MBL fold hydrolase [Clostridia bacterium]|nr:MBL fold hydrolase [Clostridia bacterium]
MNSSLSALGLSLESLSAICLTHEHGDHTSLLRTYHRLNGVQVVASGGTIDAVAVKHGITNARVLAAKDALRVGGMTIRRFNTSHDARESRGYTLAMETMKVGVCTDLGEMSRAALDALCGADYVVLESNHDVDMLKRGPYPMHLRRRILSRYGHLSNDDCAAAAVKLAEGGTRRIALAHLSQENNDPSVAMGTVMWALSQAGREIQVEVAPRYEMGEVFCYTLQSQRRESWGGPIGAMLAPNM